MTEFWQLQPVRSIGKRGLVWLQPRAALIHLYARFRRCDVSFDESIDSSVQGKEAFGHHHNMGWYLDLLNYLFGSLGTFTRITRILSKGGLL
jgi:hypothetical protein